MPDQCAAPANTTRRHHAFVTPVPLVQPSNATSLSRQYALPRMAVSTRSRTHYSSGPNPSEQGPAGSSASNTNHSNTSDTEASSLRHPSPRWPLRHVRHQFDPDTLLNAAALERSPFPSPQDRRRGHISDRYFAPAGSPADTYPNMSTQRRNHQTVQQPASSSASSQQPHGNPRCQLEHQDHQTNSSQQNQRQQSQQQRKQQQMQQQQQQQQQQQKQQRQQHQLGTGSLFNVQGAGPWLYRPPPPYCPLPQPHVGDHISVLDGRVGYLGPVNRNKIVRALEMATAHAMPMLLAQNLTIASIVADMQMDVDTVCAAVLRGMLHDHDDVVRNLGRDVATILPLHRDIVSVVNSAKNASNRAHDYSQISFSPKGALCGETDFANLRELILVSAVDHRAISLELAAAVVATRALDSLPAHHDKSLAARLALHLYAPLANQLGIYFIQSELEELAFMHLHPTTFDHIRTELAHRTRESQTVLAENKAALDRALSTTPAVRAHVRSIAVKGRIKGTYSCYRKLRRTGKSSLADVYDLLALRVIVQAKGPDEESQAAACYSVAEAVRASFRTILSREKDYVANPKPNGYRSLHLTVVPPGGESEPLDVEAVQSSTRPPLEIQIRTEMMHHVAEFGAAAHWVYKAKSSSSSPLAIGDVANLLPTKNVAASSSPSSASTNSTLNVSNPECQCQNAKLGVGDDAEDVDDDNDGMGSSSPSSESRMGSEMDGRDPDGPCQTDSPSPSSFPTKKASREEARPGLVARVTEEAEALVKDSGTDFVFQPCLHDGEGYAMHNLRRSGYVKSLARAISASRVIVSVYGRLYRMWVGATLRDLALELGVTSLGMAAVVNGIPVPLTHRLKMSDNVAWL